MKTLLLIRHAKSSWDDIGMSDSDRPLNERGKKDAPEMAKRLKKMDVKVDHFLSSTAKRALRTARFFAAEFDVKKEDIQLEDRLYAAETSSILQVVQEIKNKYESVALFAHNPGLTDFANTLTPVRIDNIPTCGIFAVQADTDDWKSFGEAEKNFLFFDYPKNPLGQF